MKKTIRDYNLNDKKVIISKLFIKNKLILLHKCVRIEKIFKRGGWQLKNLVVKTALITLITVLSVAIITFALLTAFAPGVMYKVTSGLGMDKTALSFAVRYYEKTEDALSELRNQGYTLLAVEQCKGSTMLQQFIPDADKKYAVIMGNEVKGVQQQVVNMCDGCLEIPQFGTKHSMNVSVTAGIVMWHFAQSFLLKE